MQPAAVASRPPKAGDPTAQPFIDLINAVIDRQAHDWEHLAAAKAVPD